MITLTESKEKIPYFVKYRVAIEAFRKKYEEGCNKRLQGAIPGETFRYRQKLKANLDKSFMCALQEVTPDALPRTTSYTNIFRDNNNKLCVNYEVAHSVDCEVSRQYSSHLSDDHTTRKIRAHLSKNWERAIEQGDIFTDEIPEGPGTVEVEVLEWAPFRKDTVIEDNFYLHVGREVSRSRSRSQAKSQSWIGAQRRRIIYKISLFGLNASTVASSFKNDENSDIKERFLNASIDLQLCDVDIHFFKRYDGVHKGTNYSKIPDKEYVMDCTLTLPYHKYHFREQYIYILNVLWCSYFKIAMNKARIVGGKVGDTTGAFGFYFVLTPHIFQDATDEPDQRLDWL